MKSLFGLTTTTLSLCSAPSTASTSEKLLPRSNHTHLVWYDGYKYSSTAGYEGVQIIEVEIARKEAYQYLRDNAMTLDLPFLETLGFHREENDDIDGLANGLVQQVLNVSIQAKIDFPYTDALPKNIWNEYVLNYSSLNEARSNVRRLLRDRLVEPLLLGVRNINNKNTTTQQQHYHSLKDTVYLINQHMWTILAPANTSTIRFVSGQTPAIFDSMSVLAFGYASCTGTSILFVEALRAAGVPARIAGTAAWNSDSSRGNHNWVEVLVDENHWKFLEPSPGLHDVDSLDREPCSRWFCNPDRMGNGTHVYAAALDRSSGIYFPLAWERDCMAVPAVNRTDYYRNVCSSCGTTRTDDEDAISSMY